MPELPEMRALGERLDDTFRDATVTDVTAHGFSALRTVRPSPNDLIGERLARVSSRGKYLVLCLGERARVLVHLGQAGRVDLEERARSTRGRGAVMRLVLGSGAIFVREYGTERRAAWWVLAGDDAGPLATLGPEPDEDGFASLIRTSDDGRHLHTALRDQHFVAGIGRGYTDDILHRARRSPFASLASLDVAARDELLVAVRDVLGDALAAERSRRGGLSEANLSGRFAIHNRFGTACPRCGTTMERVAYATHEITYCPTCQTNGRVLADRRLSRLLR